ncbi:hypothetical protein ACIBL6_19880 [Streptomyces sp. NPDC050400]|uniref:hypothetical protein n=1 Tax=Streptomyces sp. NPDC050400 TaxID=3365610 RepID=UPI0037A0751B
MDTTVPGPGLTALCQREAETLPRMLADMKVEALYACTHVRTQLTAAPFAADRGLGSRYGTASGKSPQASGRAVVNGRTISLSCR